MSINSTIRAIDCCQTSTKSKRACFKDYSDMVRTITMCFRICLDRWRHCIVMHFRATYGTRLLLRGWESMGRC